MEGPGDEQGEHVDRRSGDEQRPAVLNDWFRRATALADAFREESRSKS
ncbi:hypothetical protein ACWEQ5_13690 [Streptomyces griseoincarnatus]